jgi:hypothetical protein
MIIIPRFADVIISYAYHKKQGSRAEEYTTETKFVYKNYFKFSLLARKSAHFGRRYDSSFKTLKFAVMVTAKATTLMIIKSRRKLCRW